MALPEDFVYVKDIIPNIVEEIAYHGNDNFMGRPADGYQKAVAILTKDAANALAAAEKELNNKNLGLKIFDAYRPHRAVTDFANWAQSDNFSMQSKYYPTFNNKEDIFKAGFIAKYSAHSRGSTVDLTIIDKLTLEELDMGGIFDFFGEVSYTNHPNIPKHAQDNRQMLCEVMHKHGFENYYKEWWHFQLKDEPFYKTPDDHFDFLVA